MEEELGKMMNLKVCMVSRGAESSHLDMYLNINLLKMLY